MRSGQQMNEIVPMLQRQEIEKHDYLVQASKIMMNEYGTITIPGIEKYFDPSEYTIGQISSYLNIPREYARRLMESSAELLAKNINYWLARKQDRRMVRTIGKSMRAFLSDRYKVMDNFPLIELLSPVFRDHELSIISSDLSEGKMYIKALSPKLTTEVREGDTVQAGICISNSEIGAGSLSVKPLIYRLVCTNGLVTEAAQRKYHIWRKLNEFETFQQYLTDETRKAEEKALYLGLRDVIEGSLSESFFDYQVSKLRRASEQEMSGNVENVIEVTKKRFGISEEIGSLMLESLIRSSEYTKWGLANAVTDVANSSVIGSYETSSELEMIGGKIIELDSKDWEVISG